MSEIAEVKVNGLTATLHYSSSPPYLFQRQVNLPAGVSNIQIEAKDGSHNTTQKDYEITIPAALETFSYDTNGNLTTRTKNRPALGANPAVAFQRETYTWDRENRLVGWEKRRLEIPGEQTEAKLASTQWTYDGFGRRVKERNEVDAVVTEQHHLWDGLELIQWRALDGTVAKNLFNDGEQNVSTGETLIYATDHLGSVRGWYRLSDGA